jgi:hypothetical protein
MNWQTLIAAMDWQTQLIAEVAAAFAVYAAVCWAGFLVYMWLTRRS